MISLQSLRLRELLSRDELARDLAVWAVQREERRCASDGHPFNGVQGHYETFVHGGFTWHDAGVDPARLPRLVGIGLLSVRRHSARSVEYDLRDVPATIEALRLLTGPPSILDGSEPPSTALPAEPFRGVVGLELEKRKLTACLKADKPVHALLVGDPATGKSVLVSCIEALPGGFTTYGGAITPAGLRDLFFDASPPRWLIVDECEEGKVIYLNRLLSVLEEQRITVLQHGRRETREIAVTCFLVCNDDSKLPLKLKSRVGLRLEFHPLDEEQRQAVIRGFLVEREGVEPELAAMIAFKVAPRSADVRRARDVARLCNGSSARLDEYVGWLP
ncbi:MAG TPA: hypothetical protein VMU89_14710 [Thermomicrobiaceae bacterium]|nr:hypothetical protein [Thermomicrobiaceae bacterium]